MSVVFLLTLIYVGLVYIRPQEYISTLEGVPILPSWLIVTFILWLVLQKKNFEASQHWLLPLLLFTMVLSVAATGWLSGAFAVFNNFYPIVILFYLVSTSTDTVSKHQVFMKTLAVLTTILALHGVDQIQTGVGWSGAIVLADRITYLGVFNDPNDLALAFVIALPMLVYGLTEAKLLISKAFWVFCIAAILYGIILTNSRGGMLSAIALFVVYFYRRFGVGRALILTTIGLVAVSLVPTRLSELDAGEASAAGRVDAWFAGIQMLQSHPIFGVGQGGFTDFHIRTAHNSIVLAFAELGLVGYFFWLAFIGLSVHMVYKISIATTAQFGELRGAEVEELSQYKKISQAYLYAMFGFSISAFFLSRSYNILLFILCSLCVALYQSARQKWPRFSPIPFANIVVPTVAFEIGSIFFMYILVKKLLRLGQ